MNAQSKPVTHLEVWSDIACPWCWIGKRHLEEAATRWEGEVAIEWRAFQLNPAASKTSTDTVDYAARIAGKYGTTSDQAQGFVDQMVAAGESVGVEIRFDRIRPFNSANAHCLLAWAREFGLQAALAERLFSAYLKEGLALNDRDVLLACVADVGLDSAAAIEVIAADSCARAGAVDYPAQVLADQGQAQDFGASGVPFFVVDRRVALSGAQPADVLLQAFAKAAEVV